MRIICLIVVRFSISSMTLTAHDLWIEVVSCQKIQIQMPGRNRWKNAPIQLAIKATPGSESGSLCHWLPDEQQVVILVNKKV